jgi:predicted TIM-barrel fold metal-dependent hydrolase
MTVANVDLHDQVQAIRQEIDHPIIDCDGHFVEFLPDLVPFLKRAGIENEDHLRSVCAKAAWGLSFNGGWSKLSREERQRDRVARPSSHDYASNPLDRATTMLPELMYQRLEEIGIDFALAYPSLGNFVTGIADEKTRRIACHEFNEYSMSLFAPYADRLTPPAVLPMITPEEAVDEVEHAHSLGFKLVLIPAYARRYSETTPAGVWFDSYGMDSLYDYDALWSKTTELGIPVTGHGNGYGDGWLARQSPSNYAFSHMGHFATAQELLCRTLLMGGVTRRFPQQRFSFLEGGVAWAAMLFAAVISHWEKRNPEAIRKHVNEHRFSDSEKAEFQALVGRYGGAILERSGTKVLEQVEDWLWDQPGAGDPEDDDWAAIGCSSKQDFVDRFVVPFAFGAESDDPMTATAFSSANPFGARLKVLFSSDMGHFDVPDLLGILGEAHEGVQDGWMTAQDFRDFTFTNPATFLTDMNPEFFTGTKVESAVKKLRAG